MITPVSVISLSTTEKLAPGAPPPEGFIPLIVPEIRGNEWTYVKDCLDTGWVSSVGSYVDRFERALAEKAATRFAVATVNGTSAIHVALLLAGVRPDEEVLVSTLTFIAPVNAIRYAGAWPVFVDAEPNYWQMDATAVARFLDERCERRDGGCYNRQTGRRVAAVLPVHILGHPVELGPILEAAARHGLPVIEDATEGLGALYEGRPIGSFGIAGCFSFNGNKLITTGGGGMLVTNDPAWAERAKYLTTQAKNDPVEYVHDEIGYNYRLTNVQAAIGCGQLELLDSYVEKKRMIARTYREALADLPGITVMPEAPWATSSAWMYTVLIDPDRFGKTSRELLRWLANRKVMTRPLWQPVHLSKAHAQAPRAECPVAEWLCQRALSLPCSVGLSPQDLARVIAGIREAYGR